jgi:transposase-like protein
METSPVVPDSAPRKRRRFSPEQIQAYLDAFSQCQLSATEFCRQHQIGYATFQRWRQGRASAISAKPRFASVPLGSLLAQSWAVEVTLPNGCALRLQTEMSPDWVASVLEALRRSC